MQHSPNNGSEFSCPCCDGHSKLFLSPPTKSKITIRLEAELGTHGIILDSLLLLWFVVPLRMRTLGQKESE